MTLAPIERALSLRPRVEDSIDVPTPSKPTTWEPEETAQQEELALVLRRRPPTPPGFTMSWADESGSPPPDWQPGP